MTCTTIGKKVYSSRNSLDIVGGQHITLEKTQITLTQISYLRPFLRHIPRTFNQKLLDNNNVDRGVILLPFYCLKLQEILSFLCSCLKSYLISFDTNFRGGVL